MRLISVAFNTVFLFSFDRTIAYSEFLFFTENEQTLRDRVSNKSPRIPRNAFKPFPDPSVQPTNLVDKCKKRFTTIAMNDKSILKKYRQQLDPKRFAESEKKSSVETMNDGGENGSTFPCDLKEHKVNHTPVAEEIKLRQENNIMNATIKQPIENNRKLNIQNNEIEISSEESSEDDESSCDSNNAMLLDKNGRKISSFADPEKKMLKHTFVIHPKKSTTMAKEAPNEGTILKKKYKKLKKKCRLLKTIFIEQQRQYRRDLQIQNFAQSLYQAIKKRYNSEEEDE
ncbi:unnamed protein product [Chilo suppressalis]|uniref:Uncharacterized protein n=1 Tax=Chilo suppressalis TaxID=168631 RepID=A0ABN8L7K1_CHISP|nr:unnamed protein product [Chilo suppressalis]